MYLLKLQKGYIMIKKQMFFTDRELKLLQTEAKEKGLSFAELVRRILDQYLEKKYENIKTGEK